MTSGFVITYCHDETHRPTGRKMLERLVRSIRNSVVSDYKIFIIDNSSTLKFEYVDDICDDTIYYRISDQKNGGLTYAWNVGVNYAFDFGCDVILNINDDLVVDETVNSFIDTIRNIDCKSDGLFGPVSNDQGVSGCIPQIRDEAGDRIIEVTNLPWNNHTGYALNGFFLGFHSEFVKKYRNQFWLFSTREYEMWGGQEDYMFYHNTPKGMRSFIIETCFVHHDKLRSWFDARSRFGHKRTTEIDLKKRYSNE
jgi:glycosyltransferase involved in cell wall biosynthesis